MQARYCLSIAQEIQRWPREHCFKVAELEAIATSWAVRRVTEGWAAAPRWPKENFRSVACSFLKRLGCLAHDPAPPPGRYDAWLKDFLQAECQERELALATCKNRQWHIQRFLTYLDQQEYSLERLTPDHVDAYLKHLGQTWSRVSLNSTVHALRTWFRYCENMGRTPAGLADSILATPDRRRPQGQRDYALLLFLYNSGARASEAGHVTVGDLDLGPSSFVRILGKGRKIRLCPLWPHTAKVLRALLGRRLEGPAEAAVFLNVRGEPLTRFGIHTLVERIARRASKQVPSLQGKRVSPHVIRHSTACHLLRGGVDINTIRDWLGHVSLETTNRYAKVDLEMKAKALAIGAVTEPGRTPSEEKASRHNPALGIPIARE